MTSPSLTYSLLVSRNADDNLVASTRSLELFKPLHSEFAQFSYSFARSPTPRVGNYHNSRLQINAFNNYSMPTKNCDDSIPAINLAGALTSIGKSVLVVDLDGQGDLTTGVGFDYEVFADSGSNIYTLLTDSLNDMRAVVRPAPNDRFDVVPGNIQMYLVDKALYTVHNRERRLERVLEAIGDSYDYILIDCPPNLGTVTDNARLACRHVLVRARMNKKNTRAITILQINFYSKVS